MQFCQREKHPFPTWQKDAAGPPIWIYNVKLHPCSAGQGRAILPPKWHHRKTDNNFNLSTQAHPYSPAIRKAVCCYSKNCQVYEVSIKCSKGICLLNESPWTRQIPKHISAFQNSHFFQHDIELAPEMRYRNGIFQELGSERERKDEANT